MSVRAVTCPRCEGSGAIRQLQLVLGGGGRKEFVEADCPLCSGTGHASMLEKIARPTLRSPQRDVA